MGLAHEGARGSDSIPFGVHMSCLFDAMSRACISFAGLVHMPTCCTVLRTESPMRLQGKAYRQVTQPQWAVAAEVPLYVAVAAGTVMGWGYSRVGAVILGIAV